MLNYIRQSKILHIFTLLIHLLSHFDLFYFFKNPNSFIDFSSKRAKY